jgi:hypothetical protein
MCDVMVHAVPLECRAMQGQEWFGTPEVQERLDARWSRLNAEHADQLPGWAANYLANEWGLAGYDVALHNLSARLLDSDRKIDAFVPSFRLRFSAALRAYDWLLKVGNDELVLKAGPIRDVLATTAARLTDRALTSLIFQLEAELKYHASLRAHLAALLQDRLIGLPERVRSVVLR